MRNVLLTMTLLLASSTLPAQAAPLPCPDLAQAVQVGNCPSEDELLFTFNGYCSDDTRAYGKGAEVCTDFQEYRRLKNTVLWESADGGFAAYLSCDLPAATIREARAGRIAVSTKGKLTHLVCHYNDDISFTHRSKATCTVEGNGECAADPAACRADCE